MRAKKTIRDVALVAAAAGFLLSGCASTAMTFPANEKARVIGALKVEFKSYGTGSGPLTITMPDGEVLAGRYSLNVGGSVGFGSVYGSVYGAGGLASGSAFASGNSMAMTNPGIADASGPRTTVHCEVMSNTMSGHGNGACETSGGALYRLQF